MAEWRHGGELRTADPSRLLGYAAIFNTPSQDLGGFVEVVRPGAFSRTLQKADHVRALYDHQGGHVLGRVGAGTLKLAEDDRGLRFEVALPPTTVARDLAVLVERGDVAGASFAFRAQEERWTTYEGLPLRELLDVDLEEITITARPAYPDTSVALRSLARWRSGAPLALRWRFLETL
jgi:HK97 family phage prohead protease